MNGELDYDDILHFPKEIVVEKINNYYLVIAVQTANWIVLYNSSQIDFLNMLRSGICVGDIIGTIKTEKAMVDLKIVLAAIFARKLAGVNEDVPKEYLEGYKMLNIYITNACNLKCKHCFMLSDVCYYAKIRILKQITTVRSLYKSGKRMFVIMQR